VGWLLEICRQPSSLRRDAALYEAIQHLQPGDFLVAIADLQELAREFGAFGNQFRMLFAEACMERWLDVDEAGAYRWLAAARVIVDTDALGLPAIGDGDLAAVYRVVARRNPEWAFEQAQKLGGKTGRKTGMEAVLFETASQNPRKAREWLGSLEGTPDWDSGMRGCIWGLSQSDPHAALELIKTYKPKESLDLTQAVILTAAQRSPNLLRELLSNVDQEHRSALGWLALSFMQDKGGGSLAWAQEQYAAMREAGGAEAAQDGLNWSQVGVANLMQHDPVRTMEWIQSLEPKDREQMTNGALVAWARTDPQAMMEWVAKTPGAKLPKDYNALYNCVHASPERFPQWISMLTDESSRNQLSVAMAQELGNQGLIAEALRTLPAEMDDQRRLSYVVSSLVNRDVAACKAHISTLPDGPVKSQVVDGVVRTLAQESPSEAASWVEGLPPGKSRDAGSAALAASFVVSDAGAAAGWIGQIGDANTRDQAASRCYGQLLSRNRPAARAWLGTLPDISEATRERIMATMR
jgi:hypothetical protein